MLDPEEKDYIEGSFKKLVFADKTERYYYNANEKFLPNQEIEIVNMYNEDVLDENQK